MSSTQRYSVILVIGVLMISALQFTAPGQSPDVATNPSRTWTHHAGKSQFNATFVEFKDGIVHLRKDDGNQVSTAIENLSDADWDYVRQQVRKAQGDTGTKPPKKTIVFQEDFSKFEKGDLCNWGDKVHVEARLDGRHWLVPSDLGAHFHAGQKVAFPPDSWYLEFDFTAQSRKEPSNHAKGFVTSGISLADEKGNVFRIGWRIDPRKHVFVLPDGTTKDFAAVAVPAHGKKKEEADYWLTGRALRVEKKGETITIFINGKAACSGDFKGLSRIVRFEVDTSLTSFWSGGWHGVDENDEWVCFTNFKVGSL